MKKIIIFTVLLLTTLVLVSCAKKPKDEGLDVIYEESRLAFNYFWETSNTNEKSEGYGLVRDRYSGNSTIASVAAVGFGLAAIPAGVENGWITKEEGQKRALGTLNTLLKMETVSGFYYHFVNLHTGKREWQSEVSVIDTGLLIAGAIVAGEYFKGDILDKAIEIYDAVNWDFYINKGRKMFYMSYKPEQGHSGAWDHVAEQLILYVLAAGAPTYKTDDSLYKTVKNIAKQSYTGRYTSTKNPELSVSENFYYNYDGSLFQYQFSHAFVDFRNIVDAEGTNWFDNSVLATKAHYAFVQDESEKYLTYNKNSWGISAGDGPGEYRAYGGRPAKNNTHNGTVAPYAAIASINYMTEEAKNAAVYFKTLEKLNGEFGFKDSFNLGPVDPNYNPVLAAKIPDGGWFASDYIGIDKGITLLMVENYRNDLIWNLFMQNEYIKSGLEVLGFKNK
ncbi:glucoamylase family protein [Haploplasma axanthum]|uniref:Uncharacterized protein conserved in bacteria n=1 Tax=Haploplasma axanthum TaxID=29552 RepID=A0A449BFJ2_HAPAX|nr:glucoamylase family protein [Haploplasma axanthum]VEU81212.1 Uncharacterized protein conserved in bacteria [Haploplasma axanthum]